MMFRAAFLSLSAGFAAIVSSLAAAEDQSKTAAQTVWLKAHNKARAQFGSEPLVWNSELEREARQWAVQLAKEQRMRHAPREDRGGSGENLWMGTKGAYTPSEMVSDFVDERADFVAGRFPDVSRTGVWKDVGHYTQIVWPETREVGCAKARGAEFDVMVCRYFPAGNQMGEMIAPEGKLAKR